MNLEWLTADQASQWASRLWMALAIVWVAMRLSIKRAKQRESLGEFAQHAVPLLLGFWLLFGKLENWGWLNYRPLPNTPAAWAAGLFITAFGVGFSIWARFALGSNWSGAVTLKDNHELIRRGPYRWIRHPIYTGILLGMIGTAIIKGHLRGWLGFVVVLATFYFKARREESFLRQEFGKDFEEHTRDTGMFLPKLI